MAIKFGRKQIPSGFAPNEFTYQGRPAKDQGDFADDVGIADMASVNQFDDRNSSKYYHAGVLEARGTWFVYTEWGRISGGRSWSGASPKSGMNFMFTKCASEAEARAAFAKQCRSKNLGRLTKKQVGSKTIWVAKTDKAGKAKDAYIVQSLATRERGLPDAYSIKDDTGVVKAAKPASKTKAAKSKSKSKSKSKPKPSKNFQPQVVALAKDLVGGTREYARAASQATGVIPTMSSITEVRDEFLPLAMERIAGISKANPKRKRESQSAWERRLLDLQISDDKLVSISKLVAALVPRVIPRGGSARQRAAATILSSDNVLSIQNDLDAFASSLQNEDFSVEDKKTEDEIDPDKVLNAQLTWIDPKSTKGKWLAAVYKAMSNNRHSYMKGKLVIKNIFEVRRPDRDEKFVKAVACVAKKLGNKKVKERARLQPVRRSDLADIQAYADKANVFLGIHGTRAVNIHPILGGNLRLPRSLPGAQITGAAFGHGIYFATDWRKSYGYTGHGNSYWASGGNIRGRGFFMFLSDVVMGDPYMARSCGSWASPPKGKDSVAAYDKYVSSLANDEHIIFDPNYQRIRYVVEASLS
ncbi:Poly(ADP-ribose) polymerase catalytic domain protein [Enhygromyxa salina]|uniref:NAD(+) ADP-ribosyltransferase n=1 Tax=Enhygromyxa salina TaxID=215803 RepID=A0A2S9YBJ0_9BACT|nr:hypothetical protein [Enhygromyxa salina]PRQ02474.1 Poly(ADP-ribose) polymerase catalytic domain protein [Enhygromyxa salina]